MISILLQFSKKLMLALPSDTHTDVGSAGGDSWFGISSPITIRGFDNPETYIVNILQILIGLGALVAVGMIIFGAITLITASGDPDNIAKGQKTITNAIIGLIIASLAFVIINFVTNLALNL
jgi:hypothetical protein